MNLCAHHPSPDYSHGTGTGEQMWQFSFKLLTKSQLRCGAKWTLKGIIAHEFGGAPGMSVNSCCVVAEIYYVSATWCRIMFFPRCFPRTRCHWNHLITLYVAVFVAVGLYARSESIVMVERRLVATHWLSGVLYSRPERDDKVLYIAPFGRLSIRLSHVYKYN